MDETDNRDGNDGAADLGIFDEVLAHTGVTLHAEPAAAEVARVVGEAIALMHRIGAEMQAINGQAATPVLQARATWLQAIMAAFDGCCDGVLVANTRRASQELAAAKMRAAQLAAMRRPVAVRGAAAAALTSGPDRGKLVRRTHD